MLEACGPHKLVGGGGAVERIGAFSGRPSNSHGSFLAMRDA